MNDVAEHEKSSSARDRALEDKWQNAREQAQAQFESIREMVEALQQFDDCDDVEMSREAAEQRIHEDALSVEIRSEWHSPGTQPSDVPAEYRILLCTGGPAVQIVGKLSERGEPETACLQMQDWFLPWTDYQPSWNSAAMYAAKQDAQDVLLAYARQFYFGE